MKIIDRDWVCKNIESFRSQRCVVITGAGISCPSGIPDYRSKEGLFNTRGKKGCRGSDYFDYRFSMQPETRPEYLRFIALFKEACDSAAPADAHRALNYLKTVNKLRVYSQNICGLEERAGLVAERTQKTELVLLHGDMKTLKCTYCGHRAPFTGVECEKFKRSEDIVCAKCLSRRGRGSTPKGIMNTTIVHYNQPHPDSHMIGSISELDKNLTLLIVVGTSMKVYGVKRLARHFLRNLNGVSLFVNLEEPSSEFQKSFQYMWKGDCNEFFRVLRAGLESIKKPSRVQKIAASIKMVPRECAGQEVAAKGRVRPKNTAKKKSEKSASSAPSSKSVIQDQGAAAGVSLSKSTPAPRGTPEKLSSRGAKGTAQERGEHVAREKGPWREKSADSSVSLRTQCSRYLCWMMPPSARCGDARRKDASPQAAAEAAIVTQSIKMSEIELLVKERVSKASDSKPADAKTRRGTVCGGVSENVPIEKGWRRFSLASSIGGYFSVKPRKN